MSNTHIATIQAALLHEALNRANKIAPQKGAAADRSGGIQIEFAADGVAHIRATDLEVTFYQKVQCEKVSDPRTIRFGSVVPPFVGGLAMDKGEEINFHMNERDQIVVQFKKTRTKATVPQITGEFPALMWFDYESMSEATELGAKVAAVAWAVESDADGVLSGIKIDGEWLEALSSKNAARIKCDLTGDATVIAVLKTLVPLIKSGSRVKMDTRPGRIIVALDETAQVTSTTILGEWPNLVERLEKFEFPNFISVRKTRITEALGRVMGFIRNDRLPRVSITFTKDSLDVVLVGTMNGDVQDSCALVDKSGYTENVTFYFNPQWLLEACDTFPGATIEMGFNENTQPVRLKEPSTSYEAYVMPMQPEPGEES